MHGTFSSDRTWRFDVTPDHFWAVISRTDEYPRWWPWLRRLDGGPLAQGAQARCEIDPPLPYNLRFTVAIREVVAPRLVDTVVDGDIAGPARLEIDPDGDGSNVRLRWELVPQARLLRGLSRVARPVMVWGHDRVVELGVTQFRRHALLDGH